MERREIMMSLHATPGIGWQTLKRLIERLDLMELPGMEPAEIARRAGLEGKKAALASSAAAPQAIARHKRQLAERGIGWIAWGDDDYPPLLKETGSPPWVLHYVGNLALLRRPCVAIVGTRVPTSYGRQVAEQLAGELAECGMTVVSGLARGIDTHAHMGALTGEGSTIAVTASALHEVYPPENRGLFRRIAEEGLLLSETPLASRARPGLFPLRNRIIVGISLGVMVVEASMASGTNSTVGYCAEYNRELFAVPGPIHSPKSAYPLYLIKRDGAKLVACAEDVLQELPSYVPVRRKPAERQGVELTADERRIVELLADKPQSVDELLHFSEFTFGLLHSVLLSLSMKHQIEQLPGSIYQLKIKGLSGEER